MDRLSSRDEHGRDEEQTRDFITIDAPVALPYGKPQATMGAGDIFGEMTCMSFYPALRDGAGRGGLHGAGDAPQRALHRPAQPVRSARSSRRTTATARSTTTSGACRLRHPPGRTNRSTDSSSPSLRPRVTLRRCEPGEIIFRQGAPATDGFYLVRTGFVKVSQARPGGDRVLNYVGPGGYFGEIGLLAILPELRDLAPARRPHRDLHGPRSRRPGPDHGGRLPRHPRPVPRRCGAVVEESDRSRLEANRNTSDALQKKPLAAFLGQGLMNAQSLLVLDLEKCTRCDECTKACADTHQGVTRLIREGLRFDKFLVASSCRSCLDPYCMVGCPVGSIRRRRVARDHHRRLVHRLRPVRRELPIRQYQHGGAVTTRPRRPMYARRPRATSARAWAPATSRAASTPARTMRHTG